VARNRKRAKERRAGRPARSEPGLATARARDDATPGPLGHATPDVELAEAQLAVGRPELAAEHDRDADEPRDEFGEELGRDESEASLEGGGRDRPPSSDDFGDGDHEGGEHLPAARPRVGSRLITFVQGSWRELQRVQWPDRRQVMQATGVVIGFVVVAGAYLGLADALAGKIVDFILK
jgi:preprotein translocase SecE subunit